MGQQLAREHGAGSAVRDGRRSTDASTYSAPDGQAVAHKRPHAHGTPRRRPSVDAGARVDGGYVVAQGVYAREAGFDESLVRRLIVQRRLAPFFKGGEDEDMYAGSQYNNECPICFLFYPTPLNRSRCCSQPICTECFVQMKRNDPAATIPPSTAPVACPYCMTDHYGVTYERPGTRDTDAGSSEQNAQDAITQAEETIGVGGAVAPQRGRLSPEDSRVVLVDQVHPEWKEKYMQAQASAARRAARRVIMRQVGDSVVPIGVSSSRTGNTLANAVDMDESLGRSAPGGNIILRDNGRPVLEESQPRPESREPRILQGLPGPLGRGLHLGRRRQGAPRPRPRTPRVGDEMARILRSASPADVEELMVAEALRLSLLEQQSQEAEAARVAGIAEGDRASGDENRRTTSTEPSGGVPEPRATDAAPEAAARASTGSSIESPSEAAGTSSGAPVSPTSTIPTTASGSPTADTRTAPGKMPATQPTSPPSAAGFASTSQAAPAAPQQRAAAKAIPGAAYTAPMDRVPTASAPGPTHTAEPRPSAGLASSSHAGATLGPTSTGPGPRLSPGPVLPSPGQGPALQVTPSPQNTTGQRTPPRPEESSTAPVVVPPHATSSSPIPLSQNVFNDLQELDKKPVQNQAPPSKTTLTTPGPTRPRQSSNPFNPFRSNAAPPP